MNCWHGCQPVLVGWNTANDVFQNVLRLASAPLDGYLPDCCVPDLLLSTVFMVHKCPSVHDFRSRLSFVLFQLEISGQEFFV